MPHDRDAQPVQQFGAFPADLYALAEWLRPCPSETVVMESTGVSWIALLEVLEERGCDVMNTGLRKQRDLVCADHRGGSPKSVPAGPLAGDAGRAPG